jgi:hypothetical protein
MAALPTSPASSIGDEAAESCTPLSPQATTPAVAIDAIDAKTDVSATDSAAATAGVSSEDLPSSDDVADVVWKDSQAFLADEAAMSEAPSSSQTADAGHDDDDESQTQLATVAARLDVEKDESPFARSDSETDSYLF